MRATHFVGLVAVVVVVLLAGLASAQVAVSTAPTTQNSQWGYGTGNQTTSGQTGTNSNAAAMSNVMGLIVQLTGPQNWGTVQVIGSTGTGVMGTSSNTNTVGRTSF
jgi:hypothetical protein